MMNLEIITTNPPDVTLVWELGDTPAGRAYTEGRAAGSLRGVTGRHLRSVASRVAREVQYLSGTRLEAALGVLREVQEELQRRPERCAECGEVWDRGYPCVCASCGHTL